MAKQFAGLPGTLRQKIPYKSNVINLSLPVAVSSQPRAGAQVYVFTNPSLS
jgi:hypothetical protein